MSAHARLTVSDPAAGAVLDRLPASVDLVFSEPVTPAGRGINVYGPDGRLASSGSEAIFAGDAIHHPMQVYQVDWSTVACIDPAASATSRRRLLETCCERGALLLPAHFAAPHGGHVRDGHDRFELRWLP